ncbi:bifunctional phosphopantothenoylcysteine decarboxylase/phosphopantothenate synthase [Microbacterium sorbitolivorans]|uniref:Coenzyme A biosynthesis bifunctional protein CoaBC n=1 Tax=Microbacterium sorbitolivorans TaxID=1867410 RepID=A0A367XT99_9MICO|nr:bifunctional phosphopantothenoylcysteine decarboxylase/phosphopantothenate synthase [Microbacterium sorbitolivorans]RCK56837.1 bifunctional phosphopantothenoylcysteine decarboxylase/phosphopantothenate synthase [Microbacterium sorbitolivorans]
MFIVVGVSGGIAAYKSVQLVRLLVKDGHDVHVVPTTNALRFVGQPTWEAISRNPVTSSVHDDVASVRHVALGQRADLVVIAPATANTMAKMAAGLADDLLGTTLLATAAPVVIAPAMHTEMWRHPATQANASTLVERGVHMVGPVSGELTGGDSGPGRMAEPEDIHAAVVRELARGAGSMDAAGAGSAVGSARTGSAGGAGSLAPAAAGSAGGSGLAGSADGAGSSGSAAGSASAGSAAAGGRAGTGSTPHPFGEWQAQGHAPGALDGFAAGQRWLVTAGGTREPLDPVRFIGNRSSGRQGVEVALAAAARGAEVTLVAVNVEAAVLDPVRARVHVVHASTTAELEEAVAVETPSHDVVVMAAAVSDYRLAEVSDEKLRKENSDGTLTLTLVETNDILAGLVQHRTDDQIIVGFAAETPGEMTLTERATAKRERKGCDLLAANEVGWDKGFESADNHLIVVDEHGVVADVEGSKRDTAEALVTAILAR